MTLLTHKKGEKEGQKKEDKHHKKKHEKGLSPSSRTWKSFKVEQVFSGWVSEWVGE